MLKSLVALVLAILALPASCPAWNVVDQAGRTVNLPSPPRRIVSLVPSVTEMLFAIGAQDLLVGVTDFCDYPPAARSKQSVGGMLAPSLETIVALKADVVVATTAGNTEETFLQLERLKIPVYVVNPARVTEVLDVVARLGMLTGHESDATRLSTALESRINAVTARVRGLARPRVLYVLWPDPLIVPGRGALVGQLLALAGGESVTADLADAYPRMSVEAAIARAPDVIILASHGSDQGRLAREKWERFSQLPAVKSGRLYTTDGGLLHRYGPRMIEGLERLARLLHPETAR